MNHFSKLFTLLFLVLFSISCAGTKSTLTTETTTSENTESEVNSETEVEAVSATETWHLTPANSTPYYGTGVEKAYAELLADKAPGEKVIVAIIDSGTDIEHEDLEANVWVNEDEIPGNRTDDDGNGYVDDVYGWNFIGGPDGSHVNKDTYELTRLYSKLSNKYMGMSKDSVSEENLEEYEYYQEIEEAYNRRVEQNNRNLNQVGQSAQAILFAKQTLNVSNIDSVSTEDLQISEGDTQQMQQAKQIMSYLLNNGATESDISELQEYYEHLQGLANYGLNPDFNPRDIVGDDYDDLRNRFYGNNDVIGPTSDHGTHVAGIVGAIRDNNLGATGIADIELMILRTVPDGDERDKDVANAIRYAAENGARVINMSFGKGYSPRKFYVDDAIRYADSVGVLMISGSGNGSENVDSTDSYPTRYYDDGGFATNYLRVGASSWQSDSMLVASFSNYGKENVDIFAPGVDVYSTYPNNEYKMESGTSMASPVVAGVAALIMSYYPELSATEVKSIILETVTKVDQVVYKPGTQEGIPFSQLSSTGGIINAYEALKLAEERSQQ
ncbi:MAG: peptidase S8 [Balneola sp.]|jgi:subtilisin family serine protease|nr:peptidase S8 [Balneola sp.]HBX67672.1 peptidase S8 [Balneolaceae bacterium]|tara:strand:+ start:1437 stop:3107 length:1671 start_codon:yes stop_codon:yes gene_type:complete